METAAIHATEHFAMDEAYLRELKESLRGDLITNEDASYDEVRSVYNAMIDKYPLMIIQCRDIADILASLKFAKAQKIQVAIRGGGHNAGGLGLCDDGLVIDLSRMKGMRLDMKEKTIRVEGGCLLGDIDHATQPFGMLCPHGLEQAINAGWRNPYKLRSGRLIQGTKAPLIVRQPKRHGSHQPFAALLIGCKP